MSRSDVDDIAHAAAVEGRAVERDLRQTMLSGLALTVPFLITVLVLLWAFGFVTDALSPLVTVLNAVGPVGELSTILVELLAAVVVLGLVFLVGLAAQHGPDTQLAQRIDAVMEDLPGVGSIYTSVERMSDVMVEGNTDSFQDVKIVEFPREGSFMLAFLTADTPHQIENAVDADDMTTVFVPMAPNPVMGGHLLNIPTDQVFDVDLTVEQGMQAIMTTGMAIDEDALEQRD